MITTINQVCIYCDNCYEIFILDGGTQKEAIKSAREEGWIIGKKHLCEKCKNALQP